MHKASVQICCKFYTRSSSKPLQQSRDAFKSKCFNHAFSGFGCISNNLFIIPAAPFESEFSGGLEEETQERLGK